MPTQTKEKKKRVTYNPAAVAKYVKANYDEVKVRMPKGRRSKIKAIAKKQGESLNGFVTAAIDERIERLGGAQAKPDTWDEFYKHVSSMSEKLSLEDFPRMDLGHPLISFEV